MTKWLMTRKSRGYVPYQVLQGPCTDQNRQSGKKGIQYPGHFPRDIRCPSVIEG